MKIKILLTTASLISLLTAGAQNANRGFAITGDGNKDNLWMNIRQVDLGTGQVNNTIFQRGATHFTITDVDNKTTLDQTSVNDLSGFVSAQYPTNTLVAAAAYDNRSDKLFFIPMRMGQLRWMDASVKNATPQFYSVAIPGYTPSANYEEANNITRMVIGADNYGYAVTNDGNHLYRFTTGKKPIITDLGSLQDADDNKGLSVHNKCSSWGGDMIADAYGKLYIISAMRNVFTIDVNTLVTTFKGTITGLPGTYTTNGAAVDADGNVVLCSALAFDGYYKMSMSDMAAKKIEGSDVVYNASDLASGNFLFQKEADAARRFAIDNKAVSAVNSPVNQNQVFPNPVVGNSFNLLLDRNMNGNYTVVLSDLAGRAIQTDKAGVMKGQQTYQVNLQGTRPAKGTYIIKVLDEKNNVVMSDKVFIL